MQNIGLASIGRLQGRAIVRDKDGNVKGELIIDSDMTVEQAAEVFGCTPEELQARLKASQPQASQESLHGRNSDHSGS